MTQYSLLKHWRHDSSNLGYITQNGRQSVLHSRTSTPDKWWLCQVDDAIAWTSNDLVKKSSGWHAVLWRLCSDLTVNPWHDKWTGECQGKYCSEKRRERPANIQLWDLSQWFPFRLRTSLHSVVLILSPDRWPCTIIIDSHAHVHSQGSSACGSLQAFLEIIPSLFLRARAPPQGWLACIPETSLLEARGMGLGILWLTSSWLEFPKHCTFRFWRVPSANVT